MMHSAVERRTGTIIRYKQPYFSTDGGGGIFLIAQIRSCLKVIKKNSKSVPFNSSSLSKMFLIE
jgi:hypothetical protein